MAPTETSEPLETRAAIRHALAILACGALLVGWAGVARGEEPAARVDFVGAPKTAADCQRYLAESSRLMAVAATMLETETGPGEADPAPADDAAARALVARGSRLFHLGLACQPETTVDASAGPRVAVQTKPAERP